MLLQPGDRDLRTVFRRETKHELDARRADATRPLKYVPASHRRDNPLPHATTCIDMPKREEWDASWTPVQLEAAEQASFERWLKQVYGSHRRDQLNRFEHNIEVWRQLWRVVEKCDILVMLAEARNPLMHFNPALVIRCCFCLSPSCGAILHS